MTKHFILDYLKKNKNYLFEKYDIEKIRLFGSYARDEATEDSDIDLVIHTSKRDFTNRYACKLELEKALKVSVDLGYFDSLRSFIRNEIKKDLIYV